MEVMAVVTEAIQEATQIAVVNALQDPPRPTATGRVTDRFGNVEREVARIRSRIAAITTDLETEKIHVVTGTARDRSGMPTFNDLDGVHATNEATRRSPPTQIWTLCLRPSFRAEQILVAI